ncbi:MAG TPA: phage tail sheath subtilisin-like domain-containing protein [Sphingobium sp.]|uniref:phage tail sheath subtilisin-like domain-containing protein n=1 Tax=Sphingobium sp. TaxID=1912891 RepID=UPI002ED3537A
MTVPFHQIPQALRVPLFYAELDPSRANTASLIQRTLIIGQILSTATMTPDVPIILTSTSDAKAAAGLGSVLAGMVDAYRRNDDTGEVWLLPLADPVGSAAATGTITFTGPATASGTLALYIDDLISIAVTSGQTATQIATAVAAAINADADLPVTASPAAGVVTLTAKNKGLVGNAIDVRVNYLGTANQEVLPAGVTATIVAMSSGSGSPVLTTGFANLQDVPFDFITCSLNDATSRAAVTALLNDSVGRWSWSRQVYGHAWFAEKNTVGTASAAAAALNYQHMSYYPFPDSPSPSWKWAAAFCAAEAVSLRADPALPLQTLAVNGIKAPLLPQQWNLGLRNSLLFSGCSTFRVDSGGNISVENAITTYVSNALGQADDSYLQVETMFTIMYVLRSLAGVVNTRYARRKLAADGTRLRAGSTVLTPNIIRAEIIAEYQRLEQEVEVVQDFVTFAKNLIVEKDPNNPSRVNVLFPGILMGGLRIFALLFQFRTQ